MLTESVALEEMIEKISDFCVYWLLLYIFSKALQSSRQCRSRGGRDYSFAKSEACNLRQ